jgi:hypothetical protein
MKTKPIPVIELGENHRRSISITLQLLDKTLSEWDDWANGHLRAGVMFREEDTFSTRQKAAMHDKILAIRELLVRLRHDLQLEPKVAPTSQLIVGHAAVLWEMLTDLNSRGLKGHGKVPDGLASYLDPIGETLCEEINAIAHLFSQPISGEIRS